MWAFVRHHVLTAYAILAFVYLMLPIGVVIAFSFNQPKGRFNYIWSSFTFDNWIHWDAVPGIRSAVILSGSPRNRASSRETPALVGRSPSFIGESAIVVASSARM